MALTAQNPTASTQARNSQGQALIDDFDAGAGNAKFVVRNSTTVLGTFTLAKPSFTLSSGVLTIAGGAKNTQAVAGTATTPNNYIISDSNDNPILAGTLTGSGAITTGDDMVLSASFTITVPAS